jgi:hypothetical protein
MFLNLFLLRFVEWEDEEKRSGKLLGSSKTIRSQLTGRREIVEKFRWNGIKIDINRQALDVFEDISNGNKKNLDFGEF